jgi:hypothetical protein
MGSFNTTGGRYGRTVDEMTANMKTKPRYSLVWAVSAAFSVLLFTAGVVATCADHEASLRLTSMRVAGVLLGAWIPGQLLTKHSVFVVAWEAKGTVAFVLAGLGALLCAVSAYSLLMSVLR